MRPSRSSIATSWVVMAFLESTLAADNCTLEQAIEERELIEQYSTANVLSRKRRYLIYPEGSSFQVVFCLTAGTYIGISDIFYMGATASLAWQLPNDPYIPFRYKSKGAAQSKIDIPISSDDLNDYDNPPVPPPTGNNLLINRFTGEPIQPFARDDYLRRKYEMQFRGGRKMGGGRRRKKLITNPAIAKRSAPPMDRRAMHDAQLNRTHLDPSGMDWRTIEFHRLSRSSLYEKIERLLRGMGGEGRHCVLKALCEIGQDKGTSQGTFLDEIMRAIFTLHPGRDFREENHKAYDEAFTARDDCANLFSDCQGSIKTIPLR